MGIMEGVSGISLGGCIVLVIAFVLHLVGFAAPYWYYSDTAGILKIYFGLWKSCSSIAGLTNCVGTDENYDQGWFQATQAFACLGFIALLVACVAAFLGIFVFKDKKILGIIGAGAALGGAVCIFLAVVIFGAKVNDILGTNATENLHASFGLCVVAFILAAVAGVLLLVESLKK